MKPDHMERCEHVYEHMQIEWNTTNNKWTQVAWNNTEKECVCVCVWSWREPGHMEQPQNMHRWERTTCDSSKTYIDGARSDGTTQRQS